jgi:hypothetical protein
MSSTNQARWSLGSQPAHLVGAEGLVVITGKEVVGHGRSYAASLLCYRAIDSLSSRFLPEG